MIIEYGNEWKKGCDILNKPHLKAYGANVINEYLEGVINKTTGNAMIIMWAENEQEAFKRYKECISRHSELKPCKSPEICECGNIIDILDNLNSELPKLELEQFHSTAI